MSPPEKKTKLWVPKESFRAKKLAVIAAYADFEFEIPQFTFGESNKTAEFLKKNPIGRVPVLELADGRAIFESGAIFNYIASQQKGTKTLFGRNEFEAAEVNQWLYFTVATVEPPAATWLYPLFGYRDFDQKQHEGAVAEFKRIFEALNRWFETRTYLVGERLTAADLSLATTLMPLYKAVFDPKFRGPFINVNRWFETITQQEKFRPVWGLDPNAWCTVAQKAVKKPAAKAAKKDDEKEEEKPAAKPAAKAAKAAKKDDDEEEDEEPKEQKPKNPLDLLPKSAFVLDEFKREFSNKPLDEALDFFYKNFDAAGYTLWYAKYKYNDELTKLWLTANLINGWFQRMESMRKYAFGVMSVFGEDNKNEISGFWVFRGTGDTLPEAQLAVDDTGLYDWTQINFANIEGEKARIRAYLNGDEIDGKPYADGKTFK